MTGRGGSRGVLGAWALAALVLSGGAPARDAAAEASGAAAEGPSAPAPATEIPPAETPVAEAAPAGDPSLAALGPATGPAAGPVTGLPLPRFVSLKAREARARRGPSLEHRVDWLYRRRGLPLLVTAEHGHWRRVEDIEGYGGWVHYSLISGARTAIVTEDLTALLRRPDPEAPVVARLEAGVIAALGECQGEWCRLAAEGHRGWAPRAALWGTEPDP